MGGETWALYDTPKVNGNQWNRGTLPSQWKLNLNKPWHLEKSCAPSFGTEKTFCWLISYHEANQSMHVFTGRTLRNCAMQYRTSAKDYCQNVLFFCTIMFNLVLQTWSDNSYRNLTCTCLIILTTNRALLPSDFHLFLHLKSFLGGQHFNIENELKEHVITWLKI